MTKMFGSAIWFALAGFLVTLFVPVVALRTRNQPAAPQTEDEGAVPVA